MYDMYIINDVSVPLRGCGFEIRLIMIFYVLKEERFRPLTGMWF